MRSEDEALAINKGQLGYGEKRRNGYIFDIGVRTVLEGS